jgi:NTP pyrophosphatase (non-canonical NTP hydrolase)
MNLDAYQKAARSTDQVPGDDQKGLIVPLLGLVGEAGSLVTEYKKLLRDGPSYKIFKERIAEEIGDVLWYLANVATKAGLSLEDIANANLKKVRNRWTKVDEKPLLRGTGLRFFDEDFPENERLPRHFSVTIREDKTANIPRVRVFLDGKQIGNYLTDNAYSSDGYRFHDVFHLSYAAVLAWSPVTRANLKRKRKSKPQVDEVEDGGRAVVIEEAVAALVFDYAKYHSFLLNVTTLDYSLLQTIKSLTQHLEVSVHSLKTWEDAILQGYVVWRQTLANGGGDITINMEEGTIAYQAAEK